MNARSLICVRTSTLGRSQEPRRLVRDDPGASYCVDFRERQHNLAVGDVFGPDQAVAADSGLDPTLTYSTQATTILTPTATGSPRRSTNVPQTDGQVASARSTIPLVPAGTASARALWM